MASQGQALQSGGAHTINMDSNTWYRLSCQIALSKALEVTTDPSAAQKSYILQMKDTLSSSIGQSWQISRQFNGTYQLRTKLLGSGIYLDVDISRNPATPRLSPQPLLGINWMIDPWPENSLSTGGAAYTRIWNMASGNSSFLQFDPQTNFLALMGDNSPDSSGSLLWSISPLDTVNNVSYSSSTQNTANPAVGTNTTSPTVYTTTKIQTITSSYSTDGLLSTLTASQAQSTGDFTSLPVANSSAGALGSVTLENSPSGMSITGIVGIGLGVSMGLLVAIAIIVICLKQRRPIAEAIDPFAKEIIRPDAVKHIRRSKFDLETVKTSLEKAPTAMSPVSPVDAKPVFPTNIPLPNLAELEQLDPRGVSPIPTEATAPVRSWDSIIPKNKRPVELDIRSSRL
ncbi:MAG: hypothetical protein M1829_005877 [Trizodia sp. TS-e1964]|nr:MAG: hypothetical protein M1829_005877 [Trizodia sp. TS-e1964]